MKTAQHTSDVEQNKTSSYLRARRQFRKLRRRIFYILISSPLFFFFFSRCHSVGCRPELRACEPNGDWCLMRMTLTGSLSRPCQPTLTLLIPHVTQGVSHNARRTISSYLRALAHTRTHTCITWRYYVLARMCKNTCTLPDRPEATEKKAAWLLRCETER